MMNLISFYILACIFYSIIRGLNIEEGERVSFNKLTDYTFLPSMILILIFIIYIKLKNNN